MKRVWIGASAAVVLALAASAWLFFSSQSEPERLSQPTKPVAAAQRFLVLYQAEPRGPGTHSAALLTANLLGRFGRAEIRDLDSYHADDADRFAAVFVLPAFAGAPAPQTLLSDVRASQRPVVWIQQGVKQLFEDPRFADAAGWRPEQGGEAALVAVKYKGQDFTRDVRNRAFVTPAAIVDPKKAQVLAWAVTKQGGQTPWAVRSGRLTYLLEAPYAYAGEDDRYLVFADLLFATLAPQTPERHRAMVRIEDVGPEADPERVRRIADLLHHEGVPFSVAVYDSYRDPLGRFAKGRPTAFELSERPWLVSALRYACDLGGVLVAHGHTHQYDSTPNPYAAVSGGDYEFYRAALNGDRSFKLLGPLPDDTAAHWRERLGELDRGWARAGVPPATLFTTPHYAASRSAYAAIRTRFPIRYERVTYFPGEGVGAGAADLGPPFDQLYPFETVDSRGDFIIPENLGYISSNPQPGPFGRRATDIAQSARRNLAVRDGYASFFFHWYEDPAQLLATVQALKRMGYTFVLPAAVVAEAPIYMRPTRPVVEQTLFQRLLGVTWDKRCRA